jgi:DDE superfamily endonuclease
MGGTDCSTLTGNITTTTTTTTTIPPALSVDYRGRSFVAVSFDEFGPVEVRPQKGSSWARERHPDRVPATYHRDKGVRHLLSSYDLTNDEMRAHMKEHKTNVEFLAFLKYLRSVYPAFVLIYVILDNFSPHIMDRVLAYALENNMSFVLTPTNASWLNPIEPHFGPLRKFAISNCDPTGHPEIATSVRRYIAWRNRHHAPPKKARRKRVIEDGPHLCGKCGIELLEGH